MLKRHPINCKLNWTTRVLLVKTQNMGALQIAYIVVSHVLEVNLVMFFISAVNITAGGECTNTEFVFLAINRLINVAAPGAII